MKKMLGSGFVAAVTIAISTIFATKNISLRATTKYVVTEHKTDQVVAEFEDYPTAMAYFLAFDHPEYPLNFYEREEYERAIY
jgi:hypothetical protein